VLGLAVALASLGCNLISAERGGPNVLLVTIDTLRADRVGVYGARDVATPTLDALAARGVLFEEAMASVPLTLPSHTSILTGQYPPTHGVRHNAVFVLPRSAETIAERFSEAGYATGAVVGAAVLDSGFGLEQGFDHYDSDIARERASAAGYYERPAKEVTDRALAWLADQHRPFFLWVHYYDVHVTHNPPEPFKTRFQGHLYDGEVANVDFELGRLLASLDHDKLLANTIVAVTADHGEGLGEHGEGTHSYFVYDSVLHVPLMFAGPGIPAGVRVAPVTPNTGIAATLLALAGIAPLHHVDVADLAPAWRAGGTQAAGEAYAETLAGELEREQLEGRLWIIEIGRLRVYQGEINIDTRNRRNIAITTVFALGSALHELRPGAYIVKVRDGSPGAGQRQGEDRCEDPGAPGRDEGWKGGLHNG
jgi:arylsulfatase A-like enzyme